MRFSAATVLSLALASHTALAAPAPRESESAHATIAPSSHVDSREITPNSPDTCGVKYLSFKQCQASCNPEPNTCGYCEYVSCGIGADQFQCVCGPRPNDKCQFYPDPPLESSPIVASRETMPNSPDTCGVKYLSFKQCQASCNPKPNTCGYCEYVTADCGIGADQFECVCGPRPNAQCEFYPDPPMEGLPV